MIVDFGAHRDVIHWLIERRDSYGTGIPFKKLVLPWIFVMQADDASTKTIVEAAITKGLKKQVGTQAFILSADEFAKQYANRFCFAEAMVWIGIHPPEAKPLESHIDSYKGIPYCWLESINETEESKRKLWNSIKELRFYAA